MHALHLVRAAGRAGQHRVGEVAMAGDAVGLQDVGVLGLDADRLVEVLQREALRVVPAVLGLGHVLAHEIVRQVAVDAHGDAVVARLLPGIELRPHDVAVLAGFGVRAQVGQPFGVAEGEGAHAQQDPDRDRHGRRNLPPARRPRGARVVFHPLPPLESIVRTGLTRISPYCPRPTAAPRRAVCCYAKILRIDLGQKAGRRT
jgi:hypothetical protein